MRVIAIDPGKATGMAWWDDGLHSARTVPYGVALEDLETCLVPADLTDLVVCEDFVISERTLRTGTHDWRRGAELEFIGVARWLCAKAGVEFALQGPDRKGFSTDAKLRAMGWWTPGLDHARDASRHLLVALVERGQVTLSELARRMRVESG